MMMIITNTKRRMQVMQGLKLVTLKSAAVTSHSTLYTVRFFVFAKTIHYECHTYRNNTLVY